MANNRDKKNVVENDDVEGWNGVVVVVDDDDDVVVA